MPTPSPEMEENEFAPCEKTVRVVYTYIYIYSLLCATHVRDLFFICVGYRSCKSLAVEVELGLAFGADKGHKIGGMECLLECMVKRGGVRI